MPKGSVVELGIIGPFLKIKKKGGDLVIFLHSNDGNVLGSGLLSERVPEPLI